MYLDLMHQSVASAKVLPGNSRGFAPTFSPGLGIYIILIAQGYSGDGAYYLLSLVPSCQLMTHGGAFHLQTDLSSIAAF